MKEIDDELAAKEAQMAKVTIDAQERIGKAKLQVQPTQVVAGEMPGRGARAGDGSGAVPAARRGPTA